MEPLFRPDLFARRTVLVTGGATGIGYAIAHAFAAHGARLHILSRDATRLKDAATRLGRAGLGGAEHHPADVRDAEAVQAVADQVGAVDVLVNAAAGNFPAPFSAMSRNAWESVVDIVLKGTANACRAFGPALREAPEASPGGRSVLNIVAGYAWTGAPALSHSGAAKAGVLNLTRSLAVEWAPEVRCNAVSPGPIGGTEGMRRLGEEPGLSDAVVRSIPMGRMGAPEDVAHACMYLASDAARFVTGACLVVDGGQDAVGPFGGLLGKTGP